MRKPTPQRDDTKMLHVKHQRYVTPIGKIAVIKTLAISQLNDLFIPFSSPNKHILKELKTACFNFIFKPDKVKRTTITKNYQDVGLNMKDLNNFTSLSKQLAYEGCSFIVMSPRSI